MNEKVLHVPVLLDEVIDVLNIKKNKRFIDATLGAAGHTIEILKRGGQVLGIDMDAEMLDISKKRLNLSCPDALVTLVQGNFRDIDVIAEAHDFFKVDGILMDLGISSVHIDSLKRGFSFKNPKAPLDMRLSKNQGIKAADLLNGLREDQIFSLFSDYLDYKEAKYLSKKIVEKRKIRPFSSVGSFLEILPENTRNKDINFATLPLMVLRIAVNSEINNLVESLPKALNLLENNGILAVITFHSGEDKVVKNVFSNWERENKGKSFGPISPKDEEVKMNKRSRSAKLRYFIYSNKNE